MGAVQITKMEQDDQGIFWRKCLWIEEWKKKSRQEGLQIAMQIWPQWMEERGRRYWLVDGKDLSAICTQVKQHRSWQEMFLVRYIDEKFLYPGLVWSPGWYQISQPEELHSHPVCTLPSRKDYVHTNSLKQQQNQAIPKDKIPIPAWQLMLLYSTSHLNFMHFNWIPDLLCPDGDRAGACSSHKANKTTTIANTQHLLSARHWARAFYIE